jgi:hypothetical protein
MPIAIEAVRRFAIEHEIAVRRERLKPLVDGFETWLRGERRKLSSKGPLAEAIDCTFDHWKAFARFLDAVSISVYATIARWQPESEPQNVQLRQPTAMPQLGRFFERQCAVRRFFWRPDPIPTLSTQGFTR